MFWWLALGVSSRGWISQVPYPEGVSSHPHGRSHVQGLGIHPLPLWDTHLKPLWTYPSSPPRTYLYPPLLLVTPGGHHWRHTHPAPLLPREQTHVCENITFHNLIFQDEMKFQCNVSCYDTASINLRCQREYSDVLVLQISSLMMQFWYPER